MPPAGSGLRHVGLTDEEFCYQRALISRTYFNCALIQVTTDCSEHFRPVV